MLRLFLPKTSPMQHSCSHYSAFRSITWLTRISLHAWQQSMTTIMQPLQCDLQPQTQETHRTTHTGTTTRCRTQRRNQFAHETTAAAPAAHTRYLSSPPAVTLHGKHEVSCSGFTPKTSPMQNSCSYYSAFCSIPFITTSLPHFPSSPLPFVTTSLRHQFPSSPLPSSPLPFVTTSQSHHFPNSPLPFETTLLRNHSPFVTLPFVTTSFRAFYSFVM